MRWLAAALAGLVAGAAFAQTSDVVDAVPAATQSLLAQGVTGTFALIFLTLLLLKDRENRALADKMLQMAVAQAASEAKQAAVNERLVRFLERQGA